MTYIFTSTHPNARIEGRRFEFGVYQTDDIDDAIELRKSPWFNKSFKEVTPIAPDIVNPSTKEPEDDPGKPRRGRKPGRPAAH